MITWVGIHAVSLHFRIRYSTCNVCYFEGVKRFYSTTLKEPNLNVALVSCYCEWICNAESVVPFFFFLKRFSSCTVTEKKKVVVKSTHICGFSPVCTTCCACCMPCFCLSSWEFGLLHHRPLSLFFVCCRRSEGLSSLRLTDLFIFYYGVTGLRAVPWLCHCHSVSDC